MKTLPPLLTILSTIGLLMLSSCDSSAPDSASRSANPWDDLPELHIERTNEPAADESAEHADPHEPDEDGMITITVGHVPPQAFLSGVDTGKPIDYRQIARDLLERAGVSFPEGAHAWFDPVTGMLEIRNTPEQAELAEAYLTPIGSGPEKVITCHFEVFEMPAAAAQQLVTKADSMPHHDRLRDHIIAACKRGDAEFITSVDLPTRSGMRSKTETGARSLYPLPKTPPGDARDEAVEKAEDATQKPRPLLEWRQSGLEVEVDAVLGGDSITIDLTMAFTQAIHRSEKHGSPDSGQPVATLLTNFSVIHRTTHLLGTFPAQVATESTDGEKRQRLVFVQASVHPL